MDGSFPEPRPGDFAVLDAGKFVVLLPQVGLEDFRRCQKTQDGRVTLGEAAHCLFGIQDGGQERSCGKRHTCDAHSFEE